MGIEKKVVSIRLEETFIQKLRDLGASQNRSLSNMIETILKEYITQLKQKD